MKWRASNEVDVHAEFGTEILGQGRGDLAGFRRLAFAAAPLEARLLDGRRRPGQERYTWADADATGVP